MSNCELKPARVFEQFAEINKIPRPSKHEEQMIEYLKEFGRKRNLETEIDETGNVIIRKPATKGHENAPMISVQSHMDMVCDKLVDVEIDFFNDPIQTYIDGEWLRAKGTTLGSADGMGVATAMAVLEDNTLEHGPIEAIFTVDEETCMYGVNHLEKGTLKGDILLNLDNETEGEFIIGCAGGMDVAGNLSYQETDVEADDIAMKVTIKGLKGGHSGLEISLGRANANKLLARFIYDAIQKLDIDLASWEGGNMRNAIPNQAIAVITFNAEDKETLQEMALEWENIFRNEFHGIEDNLQVTIEDTATPQKVVPTEIRDNLVNAITACPSGVLRQIPAIPEITETSCNLGIVKIADGNVATDVLVRSSCETMLDYLASMVTAAFSMAGMQTSNGGRYPAWQPNNEAPIVNIVKQVYQKVNGEDCVVQVVHAGLECGIIQTIYPHMDAISFGPTLRSPHTPFERCHIPSVDKYYKFVLELLKNIPVKE